MKKSIVFLLIIIILSIATSCSKGNDDVVTDLSSHDDYYQYPMNQVVFSYDIDEDDNLYYHTFEAIGHNTVLNSKGEEEVESIEESRINIMSPDGILINSYPTSNHIDKFCVLDSQNIIHTSNTPNGTIKLYKFNLETQASDLIYEFKDYTEIIKIDVTENRLYFIGNNRNYFDMEYSLASAEDRFSYGGQRVAYLDLNNGNLTELPLDLPISFSISFDGNVVVYGYDETKGYHFTIYNINDGSLSEPIYHDLGLMQKFEIYNENNDFIYLKESSSSYTLSAASLVPGDMETELIPDYPWNAPMFMKVSGSYTYTTNLYQTNIIRVKHSAYLRGNKKITMVSRESSITPFGCGYNINRMNLTNEEMALAMLSHDDDFDIFSTSSMQDISETIRNKGTFYPLNKVPGVMEYLDSCFPFVKEAASNTEGDIWMIPIIVDISCFIYNETLCKDNGIEFSDQMDLYDLIDTIDKLRQDKSTNELFSTNNHLIMNDFLYQYTRGNNSFNTDSFRNLANTSKSKLNYMENITYGGSNLLVNLSFRKNSDFLFLNPLGHDYPLLVAENTKIRAKKVPSLTDDKSNVATCFFITVNPASKNLEETLKYISSLCNYLSLNNDCIIYKDRDRYPDTQVMDDLYEIYSNGKVAFTYPNELYKDDFEKYLEGKLDLEAMIRESDRKLDIFLKE